MNKSQRRKLLRQVWGAIKYLQPDRDIAVSTATETEVLCKAGERIQKKAVNRVFELEQEDVLSEAKWRVNLKRDVDLDTLMLTGGPDGLQVNAVEVTDGVILVPQAAVSHAVLEEDSDEDEDNEDEAPDEAEEEVN